MNLLTILLSLILKGSTALVSVLILKAIFKQNISPKVFKALFLGGFLLSIIPFHLLLPFKVPISTPKTTFDPIVNLISSIQSHLSPPISTAPSSSPLSNTMTWFTLLMAIWGIGTTLSLIRFYTQTKRANLKFRALPQLTQSPLLQELEGCKKQAGTFAPVGLIETPEIKTPAILGWLRPRILLPQGFTSQWSVQERQSIFLHELAHFRSADAIGLTIARLSLSLHWWNPFFHQAYHSFRQEIEFAADEFATQKIDPLSTPDYASLLLKLSLTPETPAEPLGALGISETYQTLKRRIEMIQNQQSKKATILTPLLCCISIILFLGLALFNFGEDQNSLTAEAEQAAIAWLSIIDQGEYSESHAQSSQFFKDEITSEKWVEALNSVRKPLGELLSRKIISKKIQKDVPYQSQVIPGTFCIIQTESSFKNLKKAIETISLQLESDGQWRATGYFIKPK